MAVRVEQLRVRLNRLREEVSSSAGGISGHLRARVDRWMGDAAAALFHLQGGRDHPLLVGILGGTGTGKSTLLNRLVGFEASGTSFRRTFTGGPVAVAGQAAEVPAGWLGIPHTVAGGDELPVKGQAGVLVVVEREKCAERPVPEVSRDAAQNANEPFSPPALVDTPDLDGDQPEHHAEADRVFRWAEELVFIVTPEKYQMTELLGYYRLARRYGVAAWFVMNKCDETAVIDDFRELLAGREWPEARVFAVPRDDAAYEPPAQLSLAALRRELHAAERRAAGDGLVRRCSDLVERLRDSVLVPLRNQRGIAEHLLAALRLLRTSAEGVDVTPLTQQLQRRMQEQSILYLMGPGRFLQRITSLPALMTRLPRTAMDRLRGVAEPQQAVPSGVASGKAPDFAELLTEQFVILQSRIDDILRSNPVAAGWIEEDQRGFAAARFEPARSRHIAEEELADLKVWLEQHWDQSPRDTRALQKILRRIPGGDRVTKWSEAAPYLLAIGIASVDPSGLLLFGGFYLLTWLGERLSNEVVARTRYANRRIAERFDALTREQIDQVCQWLESRIPPARRVDELQRLADAVSEAAGPQGNDHA